MRFLETKGKRDRLTPIALELVGLPRCLRVQSLRRLELSRCMADTLDRQRHRTRNTTGVPILRLHDVRRTRVARPIRTDSR